MQEYEGAEPEQEEEAEMGEKSNRWCNAEQSIKQGSFIGKSKGGQDRVAPSERHPSSGTRSMRRKLRICGTGDYRLAPSERRPSSGTRSGAKPTERVEGGPPTGMVMEWLTMVLGVG